MRRTSHRYGAIWYHNDMAMTLRLPAEFDAALRAAAAEDHRSVQQAEPMHDDRFGLAAGSTGCATAAMRPRGR